jgi:hypothetical protein
MNGKRGKASGSSEWFALDTQRIREALFLFWHIMWVSFSGGAVHGAHACTEAHADRRVLRLQVCRSE